MQSMTNATQQLNKPHSLGGAPTNYRWRRSDHLSVPSSGAL